MNPQVRTARRACAFRRCSCSYAGTAPSSERNALKKAGCEKIYQVKVSGIVIAAGRGKISCGDSGLVSLGGGSGSRKCGRGSRVGQLGEQGSAGPNDRTDDSSQFGQLKGLG